MKWLDYLHSFKADLSGKPVPRQHVTLPMAIYHAVLRVIETAEEYSQLTIPLHNLETSKDTVHSVHRELRRRFHILKTEIRILVNK